MFKLGNVILSEAAKQTLMAKPQKYASLLVKHLSGIYGELKEEVKFRNQNSIFNGKGKVLSINEVDGIAFVVLTEIGRNTSVSAFYEVQEEICKKM